MNYIVLSRKWRPKKFDQVVGQEHITKILTNSLSKKYGLSLRFKNLIEFINELI